MNTAKTYRLGDLIEVYNHACGISNLTGDDISGINRDKEFFEPSTQVGVNTYNYKVVPPNYFACNLMHVGRDVVLPLALNYTNKNKYVSPAYTVFRLKQDAGVSQEYFFMYFNSEERDRLFWFHTDSSIRQTFSWEDMCDMQIMLPPLAAQQKVVAVYNALKANLAAYEQGLEDLKLVCDGFIEELRKKNTSERIGNYITQKNIRNKDKKITRVMGLSTKKEFREAQSRVNRDELGNYKIVETNDFAFVPTTDTWKVLAFSYNTTSETICVSPIYEVFSIDREKIVPGYLAIWLNRKEFDRYARYNSWGSARENFSFEDMCEVQIPLPPLKVQQSIVNIYKCYTERRRIAAELKTKIKTICPILIKGSLENM